MLSTADIKSQQEVPLYHTIAQTSGDQIPTDELPLYTRSEAAPQKRVLPSKAQFTPSGAYILPIHLKPDLDLEDLTSDGISALNVEESVDDFANVIQELRKLASTQYQLDELNSKVSALQVEFIQTSRELEDLVEKEEKERKRLEKREFGKGILTLTAKFTGKLDKLKAKESEGLERFKDAIVGKETEVARIKESIIEKREECKRVEDGPLNDLVRSRSKLLEIVLKHYDKEAAAKSDDKNHLLYLTEQLYPLKGAIRRDLDATVQAKHSLEAFLAHFRQAYKLVNAENKATDDWIHGVAMTTTKRFQSGQVKSIMRNLAAPCLAEAERCVGGIYEAIEAYTPPPQKKLTRMVKIKNVQSFLYDAIAIASKIPEYTLPDAIAFVNDQMETVMTAIEKVILPSVSQRVDAIKEAIAHVVAVIIETQQKVLQYRLKLFEEAITTRRLNIVFLDHEEVEKLEMLWKERGDATFP
ncbi:hypothetical protein HDU97_006129 [Phlyctochytrium planicorne]|nr:hypothetical protein HDU97_006129 [Phlyctochytrium planicorne]